MSIDTLAETQTAARSVLEGVSKDQLQSSSPCTEWDVAAVIDHLVGTLFWFLKAISVETPADDAAEAMSGDYLAAFDDASASLMDALSVDGFATRAVDLPFGTFTGAQFVDFVSLETLAHSWDVAKATSQGTDLAPIAAEHLLEVARAMMGEEGRTESSNFRAVQTCPPDAPAADRLAAFLGRSVN
jgi:uncharacterized protein (TIGR03086 family)